MDTSTPFKLTQTSTSSQLSLAARLATFTRRRSRSGGDHRRDRASSDHDLLRAPRPRGPTRRLCAIGSCLAQTYGRRVSRRRRRVRVRIYLSFLSSTCDDKRGVGLNQIRDDARGRRCRFVHDMLRFCRLRVARRLVLHRSATRIILHPPLSRFKCIIKANRMAS